MQLRGLFWLLLPEENVVDFEHIFPAVNTTTDDFNSLDFGLILGSGVSFQMRERVKIFLELSFDHSLDNVSKKSPVALTQAITGSIGIQLPN